MQIYYITPLIKLFFIETMHNSNQMFDACICGYGTILLVRTKNILYSVRWLTRCDPIYMYQLAEYPANIYVA